VKRDWFWYIIGVAVTTILASWLQLTTQQLLSVAGFSTILFGAIIFWKYRLAFAFFGISGLLATGLLDIEHLIEFAGLDIIIFLIAMMTIVGFLEEKHFFEHLVDRMLLLTGPHAVRIMVVMMVAAACFAALIDEVTSILFMTAAMLNLLEKGKLNPVPYVMMLIFTTNIGSSATVVGNPVGVVIAMRSGLTFMDFLRWAAPISLVVLVVAIGICLKMFAREIAALKPVLEGRHGEQALKRMDQDDPIKRRDIAVSMWLFIAVVVCLVFHAHIEHLLGLHKNTMLLGIALIGAGFVLAFSGEKAQELVEKRVDWWTLAFFLMLFSSVGTLKLTGVTGVLAQKLIALAGGSEPVLMTIFAWSSGALTAVMDNVLAVATFVPIITDAASTGINTFGLWWSTLFGSTLMGNLTLIGSTANIVAAGLIERRKLGTMSFGGWLKYGFAVGIPTLLIANLLLLAQRPLFPATFGH